MPPPKWEVLREAAVRLSVCPTLLAQKGCALERQGII